MPSSRNDIMSFISLILFIIVGTIGGSYSIGQYGIFVILLLLLVYRTFYYYRKHFTIELSLIDIKLYSIYIIVFYICTLFNGDNDFGRNSLIINYLICILIYIIIGYEIPSKTKIKYIIYCLIGIALVDALISIAQFHNWAFAWGIWYAFNDAQTVKQAILIESMGNIDQAISFRNTFCPGIFPSSVYNGYIISALGFMSILNYNNAHNLKSKIINSIIVVIICYALFIVQQRMAFYVFMAASCFYFYSKNKTLFAIILVAGIWYFITYGLDFDTDSIGRLAETQDKSREHLYNVAIEYVKNHLWVGGRKDFITISRLSAHNIILNAFMYGGVIGALFIIIIYYRMCVICVKQIINSINYEVSFSILAFAYSLLIYNLISLTHNNSLLTGEPIIWILYALLLVSIKYEKEESPNME